MIEKKRLLIQFCIPLVSISIAFILCAFLILALGENPFKVYWIFFYHSLFTADGLSYTFFYATPLIFTGLSVALCFHTGLFNIGAEGQLYIGAISITIVLFFLGDRSAWLLVPIGILTGFLFGGLWGAIPGMLKAYLGSHEVINTIMLNFIALSLANYFVSGPFKNDSQFLETEPIPAGAHVTKLGEYLPFITDTVPLNNSFFLAVFCCVLVYLFLWKTRWGYEMRSVGISQNVSHYAGIGVKKNIVLAMFIGGGIAGLVGVHEVMGFRHLYHDNFSGGIGFIGIAVALLGNSHPIGLIFAALLFGILIRGGLFLDIYFNTISSDLIIVLQGILILCVAVFDQLLKKLLLK